MEPSGSVQDYMKEIYSLAQSGGQVTTSALAARMGVTPASVTSMIKRLARGGLLHHRRYRGVELTPKGRHIALEVIRHHRLLEAYLHRALGMSWDRIHQEAEVLEHALSEELEDRIDDALGHPAYDPHGDPIPPKSGEHVEVRHEVLEHFDGAEAVVQRVSDRSPEALRHLSRLGIIPGTSIGVEKREPFGGPLWVRVGRRRHAVGRELAAAIYVSRIPL